MQSVEHLKTCFLQFLCSFGFCFANLNILLDKA